MLPGKPTQDLPSKTVPVKIQFIDNVADIALGDESILILKNDGSVWAYGIGPVTGKTNSNWTTPVQILSDAVEIASGPHHALALKKDGTVWSWGDNDARQLGDGTKHLSLKPVQVRFHPATQATQASPKNNGKSLFQSRAKKGLDDVSTKKMAQFAPFLVKDRTNQFITSSNSTSYVKVLLGGILPT